MKYIVASSALALAASVVALPAGQVQKRATPTIYLAGDSTMAKAGGGAGTEGWGQYLAYSVKNANVVNLAHGGRSARSYTDEGRFQTIIDEVQSGDYVIIEFGHNDGGSLDTTDNGRTDCYGDGDETCTTPDGTIVQTFVTYITNAGKALTAKGAKVIVSSQTPNNVWEDGTFEFTPTRFVDYASTAAENIGSGATFIDHSQYTANIWEELGNEAVNAFFPNDHTHTSPEGADVVAAAFVKGVLCGEDGLSAYISNSTSSVAGSCV